MILEEIAAKRREQIEREKSAASLETVKQMAERAENPGGFYSSLKKTGLSVIAEVKKASPSKGLICEEFYPAEIAKTYEAGGADAISVLTEEAYFQGSSDYLRKIRNAINLPILRKDFIVDPYQIYEAKAIGADAILLIAALLSPQKLKEYAKIAQSIGLDCLMEAHCEQEIESILSVGANIVGINNRNLKTFEVDLQTTSKLAKLVPKECVLVSESGIKTRESMLTVKTAGADAVLIGETLMRSADIAAELKELRQEL